MTTRVVATETDRKTLLTLLRTWRLPFTIDIVKGRRRSVEQNRLQRLLLSEITEQLGDRMAEDIRGECKLTFGVPILRAENTWFREKYDDIVRPLPYPQKLALMMEPLDMPVTRLMTTEQKTRYLDAIYRHFSGLGLVLTVPDQPSVAELERAMAR